MKEKNKTGRLTLLNFKIYYKATIIKTVKLAKEQTNRPMEQNTALRYRLTQIKSIDF